MYSWCTDDAGSWNNEELSCCAAPLICKSRQTHQLAAASELHTLLETGNKREGEGERSTERVGGARRRSEIGERLQVCLTPTERNGWGRGKLQESTTWVTHSFRPTFEWVTVSLASPWKYIGRATKQHCRGTPPGWVFGEVKPRSDSPCKIMLEFISYKWLKTAQFIVSAPTSQCAHLQQSHRWMCDVKRWAVFSTSGYNAQLGGSGSRVGTHMVVGGGGAPIGRQEHSVWIVEKAPWDCEKQVSLSHACFTYLKPS